MITLKLHWKIDKKISFNEDRIESRYVAKDWPRKKICRALLIVLAAKNDKFCSESEMKIHAIEDKKIQLIDQVWKLRHKNAE